MPSEFLVKGRISRALPQMDVDGGREGEPLRAGRYDELYVIPMMRKQHMLADEGSYFTCNNGQSGLATAAAPTSFSATNPFILIANVDSPSNSAARRIYLDFARLVATAAGTAGASVQAAVTIDTGNRYTSGGSDLTANIVSPNMDSPLRSSIAKVYGGNITAAAASSSARTVAGQVALKGAIPVVGDNYILSFGAVETMMMIASATLVWSLQPICPVIIGPNQSALIHIWLPSQSGASSYIPELNWWER